MHRYDLENESWRLEWIILRWLAPENQTEKTPELLRMDEKNISQSKTLMRGWQQARIMNLEENGARLKRNSSSVFNIWEWWWETPSNCWDTTGWKVERLNRQWKEFESDLGEGIWLMKIHSYVKLWKTLGIAPDKLEESGKILGKDLWVRAHSKDTSLNDFLKRDCTGWYKWLEWDNNLEIGLNGSWRKRRGFQDIFSTPE